LTFKSDNFILYEGRQSSKIENFRNIAAAAVFFLK